MIPVKQKGLGGNPAHLPCGLGPVHAIAAPEVDRACKACKSLA
ncbi:hypothetical protein THIX_20775 [Thiomonas sp. X19]|nr:hypothetical protein THIX_20775 [Thiomonas sp. X19]